MKIKFFEKDGHINPESIYAGVYQFKIGLLNDKEEIGAGERKEPKSAEDPKK